MGKATRRQHEHRDHRDPHDRVAAARAIEAFLSAIGRDPRSDPDLEGTGARVADAFIDDLCAGYAVDTRALVREATMNERDESEPVVVVRDIPVVTTCPHHLLPATGVATVALHARKKIVGIGAIAALVDAHARRLTLQERIGEAVVADLAVVLAPQWVGCRILLTHGCMTTRGERALGARVETIALRGAKAEAQARAAYLALGVGS